MPRRFLTRRSFLLATAGVAVAAACGGDDGGTAAGTTTTTGDADPAGETLNLLRLFADGTIVAGAPQRLVFAIGDEEAIPLGDVPDEVTARISLDGNQVAELTSPRRGKGLPRPYYAFESSLDAGIYELAIDLDRPVRPAAFSVVETPRLETPGVGDPMIPVDTPTDADPRGVSPICTREPQCPLHDVSLRESLEQDRPLAFIISTPAFCQLAVCGPVLDVLLSHRDRVGDRVGMVHAEVYREPEVSLTETTEAVTTYQLPSEPVLFLAGADGIIRSRLDNVFDEDEVGEALDALLA